MNYVDLLKAHDELEAKNEQLQKENEELKALISSDMRDTAGKLLALQEENAELKKIKSQLQQQAEIHAQEARTQRSTVHEIYQELGIQKGDWNGKVPVVQKFDELKANVNALRDLDIGKMKGEYEEYFEEVTEILDKTSAQHLAEHDARVVERAIRENFLNMSIDTVVILDRYAQQLREQEK